MAEGHNDEDCLAEGLKNAMGKAQEVMDNPEIKEMIANNQKLKAALENTLKNPTNTIQYMQDPELSPFIMKVLSMAQF